MNDIEQQTTFRSASGVGSGELNYQSGFGNYFASEAVPGALPVGRNSPQRPPHGLYAELISGTSFTAPRHDNRRSWTYRVQPSVVHRPYARIDNGMIRSAPFNDADATPTQLRWSPIPIPDRPTDFVEGIVTLGGNGDIALPVRLVEPVGRDTLLYFDAGTERAFIAVSKGLDMADVKVGTCMALSLDPRRLYLFGADGRRLAPS